MGFMEDVGRSNAMSSINNLMGKAIELRQNENQQAEKAYTLGMETEKLGMLKDEFELNMNKKKMENKRLQEEEAHAQFKTDVSTNPIIRQLPESVRKDALLWGQKQGYWDENNIGPRRNQKRAFEELTSNKEVFNRFMWPTTQAHKANLEGAISELNAEQEKDTPNPEKIAKIQQRVKGLQKIYDTATDSYSKAQEHFDKLEETKAKTEKEAKADPFTEWVKSLGHEPTTKEIAEWHRSGAAKTTVNVGGPLKAMSPEAGGRLSMLNQGAGHILEAEKMLFPGGKFSRLTAAGAKLNVPGGTSQKAQMAISNAINAKLRAETGAAATPSEMENMLSRFQPDPLRDTDDSARKKMRDLWSFLDEAAFYLDPEGTYTKKFKEHRKKSSIKDLKSFSDAELLDAISGGKK